YKEGEKVTLILEKEGPCTVYSRDIKSVDPKIEIVDKNIPLVELKKGQRVKIEMDAVMGKGRQHSKFQTAIVGYKNLPIIAESNSFKDMKKAAEICPTKVLEIKANKIVFTDATGCTMCGECMTFAKGKDELKIGYDKNAFIFNIETCGGLSNKEIIEKASELLQEKIEALKKEVSAL
ncbi:MAG: DNA-directed RNA polymerase subunit D, partial [archaeon]|nr:DNA-directed RNA polymerase subunit D [archaeon]